MFKPSALVVLLITAILVITSCGETSSPPTTTSLSPPTTTSSPMITTQPAINTTTTTTTVLPTTTQPPETTTTKTTTEDATPTTETLILRVLNCDEAYQLIQANAGNPKFMIMDVRPFELFDQGHIEGAKCKPFDSIYSGIKSLDKNGIYFIYWATEWRSGEAAEIMNDKGFKEVYYLGEWLQVWVQKGLPWVRK